MKVHLSEADPKIDSGVIHHRVNYWAWRVGTVFVLVTPGPRNTPWDGTWWGCEFADWGGACMHAQHHLGAHDTVCL